MGAIGICRKSFNHTVGRAKRPLYEITARRERVTVLIVSAIQLDAIAHRVGQRREIHFVRTRIGIRVIRRKTPGYITQRNKPCRLHGKRQRGNKDKGTAFFHNAMFFNYNTNALRPSFVQRSYLNGPLLYFGRLNMNARPPSAQFSGCILPPWASTVFCTIGSPRPVPPAFRERPESIL